MISTVERLFETMCLIRAFEDEAGKMLELGFARGSVHQYVGEEAIGTAICDQLHVTDYISSYHRGHGHSIAKGLDIGAMAKELLGRVGGTCNGKGGSMHIADFSKGMLGANGVVPDGVTLAVGAAQSIKLLKQDRVVVAFFGDGALNRGPLFEAFNWASVYELPILFVCEDNQYAHTQRTRSVTAGEGGPLRAKAFGIPAVSVDGNDVIAVYETAKVLLNQLRTERKPLYLHANTHRLYGHLAYDKGLYRDPKEVESWKKQDCILRTEQWLQQEGVESSKLLKVHQLAWQQVTKAFEEAKVAPFPETSEAFTDVQDVGFERGLR
jgi:pyruvate dehydrogenase E1 component alpha subunit